MQRPNIINHRAFGAVWIAIIVVAAIGCSSSGFESQVSGTVTLDSKAVGPGTITFAQKSTTANPAMGGIDENGRYSLKTSRSVGLHSGTYQVSVVVLELPKGQPGERIYGASKMITPEKYSSLETSGLEYDVKPGSNTINIDLKSK